MDELKKINKGYEGNENFAEKYIFSKYVRNRINSYMNGGDSLKSARTKTYIKTGAKLTVVALAAASTYKVAKISGHNTSILDAAGNVICSYKM